MTDPLKAIQTVNHRVARLAALQSLTALLPAVLLVAGVAVALQALGAHTWERWGYQLSSHYASDLQAALLAMAGAGLMTAIGWAYMSFRGADDPMRTAELIDDKLGCRQEVVTVAALADEGQRAYRSPLFPLLWRQAAENLDKLDAAKAFPFQGKAPFQRAAVLLGAAALILAATLIALLLIAEHSPLGASARQLRRLAHELANSPGAAADSKELADKLLAVANTLESPKVPPQTKLEQLARVEKEIKAPPQPQPPASSGQSKSTAKGSSGQGNGQSAAEPGQGKSGSGQGTGSASGKNQGKGTGAAKGTGEGGAAKGKNQLAELTKDLSQAKAQLQAESAAEKPAPRPETGAIGEKSPAPGTHPDSNKIENAKNPANLNRIKPGHERQEQRLSQSAQGPRKDFGSPRGDTHLGQFPEPGNFERFYKAGEHGPPLDIKDARYVLFRIPPAAASGGGGKLVTDNRRPQATVPYQNQPLGTERIAADPDERQLIPPRYRDLLR